MSVCWVIALSLRIDFSLCEPKYFNCITSFSYQSWIWKLSSMADSYTQPLGTLTATAYWSSPFHWALPLLSCCAAPSWTASIAFTEQVNSSRTQCKLLEKRLRFLWILTHYLISSNVAIISKTKYVSLIEDNGFDWMRITRKPSNNDSHWHYK